MDSILHTRPSDYCANKKPSNLEFQLIPHQYLIVLTDYNMRLTIIQTDISQFSQFEFYRDSTENLGSAWNIGMCMNP